MALCRLGASSGPWPAQGSRESELGLVQCRKGLQNQKPQTENNRCTIDSLSVYRDYLTEALSAQFHLCLVVSRKRGPIPGTCCPS